MPGFLLIAVLPYLLINYYVGHRLRQFVFGQFWAEQRFSYWLLFWLLALTPLAARIKSIPLASGLKTGLALTGDYWLAALYYFVLLWLLVDLYRFFAHRLGRTAPGAPRPPALGLAVVGVVGLLLAYGSWNARTPQITRYEITIAKPAGGLSAMKVAMVSDIHLGPVVDSSRLEGLVAAINGLQPDLILLAGDIIDENVNYFSESKMAGIFRQLSPRYGVWAVMGNHEYISGKAEEVTELLRTAGIAVLRDEYTKVDGLFYVAGRDDRSRTRFEKQGRQQLATLLQGVDRRLPVILMDHQPYDLSEAAGQGVDLQVSGHTHVGQFFPNNFVTRRMYEVDWGYLKKGDYQVIVSSGYGTWGPPIRIGNRPEIVEITVRFSGK